MTEKEFLEELEEATHAKEKLVAKVKSHGLPVILFGAGSYALQVTKILNEYGLEISGYAVDEEYYKPNKIFLNRPIYNFTELYSKPKDQVLFGAVGLNRTNLETKNKSIECRWGLLKDKNIIYYEFCPPGYKCGPLTYEFITENKEKFLETYNMLSDDLSRKTFMFYLKAQISDDVITGMAAIREPKEYFNDLTRPVMENGNCNYVDCGAYNGDTIQKFADFTNGKYGKIFALELDKKNYIALENLVKEKNYKNVDLLNYGVWNEKTELFVANEGMTNATVSDKGDVVVQLDTIDNIVGDTHIDLIKMDIEGAELNALKGAIKTLQNSHPALALSAYHRKEDLITLPQFLKNVYKNCKMYLRTPSLYCLFDFDLYVIPE